jgi:hypothetical protein
VWRIGGGWIPEVFLRGSNRLGRSAGRTGSTKGPTINTLTKPEEIYSQAVELVERRQTEALAADSAADDLRARLRSGDSTVTGAMLIAADAKSERADLLAQAAESAFARARAALPLATTFADALAAALDQASFPVPSVVVSKGQPNPDPQDWPLLTVEPKSEPTEDSILGTINGEAFIRYHKTDLHRVISAREVESALRSVGWRVDVSEQSGGIRVLAAPRQSFAFSDLPLVDPRPVPDLERAVKRALHGAAIDWATAYAGTTEPGQVTDVYATTAGPRPNAMIHRVDVKLSSETVHDGQRQITFTTEVVISPTSAAGLDSSELASYLPGLGRSLVNRLIEQVGAVTSVECTSPQSGVAAAVGGTIVRGDLSPRTMRGTLTVVSR